MRRSIDPVQRLKDDLRRLQDKVRSLELTPRLQNASISKGALRILSPEGLIVIGSQYVSGTLTGDGTFSWEGVMNISGQQNVTGPATFAGALTVTGPVEINGAWELNGNGDITGDVEVTGDVTVLPGGKIQVGNIVIDPTISGGAITFANGAQVFTDGSTIQVYKGNSVVQVADDYARLQNGGNVISIGTDGVRITGYGTVSTTEVAGSFVGAVILDGSGYLKKVVS